MLDKIKAYGFQALALALGVLLLVQRTGSWRCCCTVSTWPVCNAACTC